MQTKIFGKFIPPHSWYFESNFSIDKISLYWQQGSTYKRKTNQGGLK